MRIRINDFNVDEEKRNQSIHKMQYIDVDKFDKYEDQYSGCWIVACILPQHQHLYDNP